MRKRSVQESPEGRSGLEVGATFLSVLEDERLGSDLEGAESAMSDGAYETASAISSSDCPFRAPGVA